MIYSAKVVGQGTDEGTWKVTPQYTNVDGQTAQDIVAMAADGIEPQVNDMVLCAESMNNSLHDKVRIFDRNGGACPVIIAVFSQLFKTSCDVTIEGKCTLGEGTYKMILGEPLKEWCQAVDNALSALYQWAATGVMPGLGGGIPPFSQSPELSPWSDDNMSKNHTLD